MFLPLFLPTLGIVSWRWYIFCSACFRVFLEGVWGVPCFAESLSLGQGARLRHAGESGAVPEHQRCESIRVDGRWLSDALRAHRTRASVWRKNFL